ncbi:MAG: ribosome biogenesis GTPase YlqF [Betaproteobacteria bacterium]|nr:ribosome biogenesis GTPase YlqF [Betaproteobacteria bacterium]
MSIQWFPGHMNAARKKAAETLARADVVIEVCDARLPEASSNPMIHELRRQRQRPCLKILNKADLADPEATRAWLDFYRRTEQSGANRVEAVAISCKKAGEVARIPKLCRALAPHRDSPVKPLRLMIMGIPNAGKSTLMNALAGRRIAAVGDEPAITKQQQRLDLGPQLTLVDTPGMLWPKIEHPADGLMLAASNAVGINAFNDEEVAAFLAQLLARRYPGALSARYGLKEETLAALLAAPAASETEDATEAAIESAIAAGFDALAAIADRRGCRAKGGAPDLARAASILFSDFRSGTLGRISLETPESRAEFSKLLK